MILEAITKAGYQPGKDISLCLDPATSEMWEDGKYVFFKSDKSKKSSEEMVALWSSWVKQYPIVSIEDGMAEDDWEGWKALTETLGARALLVGDDLFCTNPKILQQGIDANVANAILIKLNQIGTVTETLETIELAKQHHYRCFISHRSGESEDTTIADLAVATSAGLIKTGSGCRTDRVPSSTNSSASSVSWGIRRILRERRVQTLGLTATFHGRRCTMKHLVLLRHGESTWNKENRFTGWTDVELSEKGVQEALEAGRVLRREGYVFDVAYTSVLKRAIKTLWLALEEMDLMWIPVYNSWRLNERHYGALQGLNKAETADVTAWNRRNCGVGATIPSACAHTG